MVDLPLIISIVVFALVIAGFLYKNRKKIQVQYKFILLYRTRTGIKTIRSLATRLKSFWHWYGYIAIPVGFIGMAVTFYFLAKALLDLAITPTTIPSVGLVIPGVTGPFWYIMISLIVVILVHEGCHGLVAESWGHKLKSVGFGFLAILPLAFVEPDEKKLSKETTKKQLSIFAAGPFANLVSAAVVALLLLFLINPIIVNVVEPTGVLVNAVDADLPADLAGLEKGDVIVSVDGIDTTEFSNFTQYLMTVKPNQELALTLSDGSEHTVTTTESPYNASSGYIGIKPAQNIDISNDYQKFGIFAWMLIYLTKLLNWLFILNIGIGLVNLLPLGPTDGGRMLDVALKSKFKNKKRAIKLVSLITFASIFLLVSNLVIPYLLKLFIA